MATRGGHPETDQVRESIVQFVADYTEQHGYPPLRAEIATHVNRSRDSIRLHLVALQKKGLLTLGEGSRAIAITHPTR